MKINEVSQESKMFSLRLNERLKKLRKKSGYSFKKLEELTGISHSTWQRYEKDPFLPMTLDKVKTLANVYGVSESYILGLESNELSNEFFESLIPLLDELDYVIMYNDTHDSFSLISNNKVVPISIDEIKDLKQTTISFLEFKLNKILEKK